MIRVCEARIRILGRVIDSIENAISRMENDLISSVKSITVYKTPEPVITGPVVDSFVYDTLSVTVNLDWDKVNVNGGAVHTTYHGRALNMPSRATRAKGGIP